MAASRPLSRSFWIGLKIVVTAGAVWWIARKVDFVEMFGVLAQANLGWLIACTALLFGMAALNAIRWKVLIRVPHTPLRKYLYYVFVGYFLTMFLPSAALAEGARTYAFGRRYGSVQKNLVAMLFGRAVGLVVTLVVAIGFAFGARAEIAALPIWSGMQVRPANLAVAVVAVLAFAAVGLMFFRARLLSAWADVRVYLADVRLLVKVVMIGLCIQMLVITTAYLLFRSVGWELALWQAAFIPATIQFLLILPVSFGGIGVREYLGLVLYRDLGNVPTHIVLATGVLAYIPMLILAGVGGVWMLYRKRDATEKDEGCAVISEDEA